MSYEEEPEARRRRYWTTQEKWQIVENAVAEVARRRGINNNQVFSWIRAAKAGKLGPRPSVLPPLPVEPDGSGDVARADLASQRGAASYQAHHARDQGDDVG